MQRCPWGFQDELLLKYHDEEWGVPVHDDRKHFEFLVLESAQAGLSWMTILRKRGNYREAYDFFEPERVAAYSQEKIGELLADPGIVRNRRKIESSINNARRFLEVQAEFGSFDAYIWRFVDFKPVLNAWTELSQLPAKTELSNRISEDLRKRGFTFVGSTIMYAHLQAIGIVNDHITSCFRYEEIKKSYA
jgi:DNA-3-methyladenine glycosylase I